MRISIVGHHYEYDFRNIANIFLEQEACTIAHDLEPSDKGHQIVSKLEDKDVRTLTTGLYTDGQLVKEWVSFVDPKLDTIMFKKRTKRTLVRQLYEALSMCHDALSKWGVLVGVRPTKLCHELMDQGHDDDEIRKILDEDYFLSEEKVNLLLEICHLERPYIYPIKEDRFSIYLSIPFCPTRCLYCSFPSYAVAGREKEIEAYTEKLIYEITETAKSLDVTKVDTIYFGGGTPAVLSSEQIKRIVKAINDNYDVSSLREFTFEAGRPDAIDEPLLETLKELGVDRVCVNPQTMDDRTLEIIGRKHNVEQTVRAMAMVKKYNFDAVNMDLIVGLPEETLSDAKLSIDSVLKLKPENITVHTLAIKRSSRLNRERDDYELPNEHLVEDMLSTIDEEVRAQGYVPYYMYRQKYMLGNLENVGYTLKDKASIYNMMIMEEKQTILAFGAGASSKFFYPSEDRFERVHNVKSLEDYLSRVDEMVKRKVEVMKS
ncbi:MULTISPECIES: coproporphyrinogen dehydrogenase HemZ [unclassified Fusibacter]|uniref:coproporphyrinogen dehydrogenase HemZ n=1 Tax=unclassified Fusibacter TaxID=2624464 RepID=UPI0013E9995C|nr:MULTISPECIES: coproporphyrinogen dehydrogenase HemZ [unclassified Fusibacter]MCK8059030.1 coproporphyrinogen dehydrogenase HemZ [Fusibacter sp. A2]NPE22441.1 coproporphyrinogen dehydrogenase HemZ [Fusibacter sp. A1]